LFQFEWEDIQGHVPDAKNWAGQVLGIGIKRSLRPNFIIIFIYVRLYAGSFILMILMIKHNKSKSDTSEEEL